LRELRHRVRCLDHHGRVARARPGSIHAAAGGVGIAATQIARNVGAVIFGTASAAKHEAIKAQGVQHAIDYRDQDFKAEIRRLTNGEGVDVILDPIGPTSFRKDYRILRPGGRLIMCGLSEALNEHGRSLKGVLTSSKQSCSPTRRDSSTPALD
jgi:synaptic vesicle membrane protein VAT-1